MVVMLVAASLFFPRLGNERSVEKFIHSVEVEKVESY